MNIAFWGEEKGSGTTSNMLAVAEALAWEQGKKTAILPSGKEERDISECLERRKSGDVVMEDCTYYTLEGLDYLLAQQRRDGLDRQMVLSGMEVFGKERLLCMTTGRRLLSAYYPAEVHQVLERVMELMEGLVDYTLIDCGSREDEWTTEVIKDADLVVVNLRQSAKMLERFFLKYGGVAKRSLFLIGSYCRDSVYNRRNMERLYRVSEEQIGVIPYNQEFCQACSRGKLDRFMQLGYAGRKPGCTGERKPGGQGYRPAAGERNRYFYDEVGRSAFMLQKSLEEINGTRDHEGRNHSETGYTYQPDSAEKPV